MGRILFYVCCVGMAFFLGLPSVWAYQQGEAVSLFEASQTVVIPDDTVPVVSIHFSFPGGIADDPREFGGRATLMAALLTQGAGDMDATAFQKQLNDLSIAMSFSAGRDHITGHVKTLTKNKQAALDLLRLVLTRPRFDADEFERMRERTIASLKQNQASPSWQAWRTMNQYFYGDHPYGNPAQGTFDSLAALTPEMLKDYAKQVFVQQGLLVAVAGDVDTKTITADLKTVFGDLPQGQKKPPRVPAEPPSYAAHTVSLDVPQSTVLMVRAIDVDEDDPDWAAAQVANYLIGGGSFSSLLMQRARSDKGLTYGISSAIHTQRYSDMFVIQTSTETASVQTMDETIIAALNEALFKGFTAEQVDAAKTYLIGSLPLALTSTDALSGVYLTLLENNQPLDYLSIRDRDLRAVTPDDVQRVAARLIGDMGFMRVVVGQDASQKTDQKTPQDAP